VTKRPPAKSVKPARPPAAAAAPTIAATLARAQAAHHHGRLAEAEQLYRLALSMAPNHADALHQLGALCHQHGRHQEAADLMTRALALQPKAADIQTNLAVVLQVLDRPKESLSLLDQALQQLPDHPAVLYNRGNALRQLDRLAEALAAYDRAVALQPQYAEAHDNRGVVLERLKRYDEALQAHDRALQLRPRDAQAQHNRGVALIDLKRFDEALVSLDRAVLLRPDLPEAHYHRGAALGRLERDQEALAAMDRALALRPDYPEAVGGRGGALVQLKRPEEALPALDAALKALPVSAALHGSRAMALLGLGRHREAFAACQQAIRLDPEVPENHWNLSSLQLLLGDFANGFANYEWRWRCESLPKPRHVHKPLWLGDSAIAGKTILLHAEQGLGDTLQFCRYAEWVADLGATVVIEVPPALKSLLASLKGVSQLVATGEELPEFDCQCPLASLPLAAATRADSIPAAVPYLSAAAERVAAWQARLPADGRRRVGIVASGSTVHSNDVNRSMPLREIEPLLGCDVHLVLLQKEIRAADRPFLAEHPEIQVVADELNDLGDTAALVAALDLVISVDTAVAHLAGALAKPLWLLLPSVPEWRWQLDRPDSPWYPTATLFRQASRADWAGVMARVRACLLDPAAEAEAATAVAAPAATADEWLATDMQRWSNPDSLLGEWDSRAQVAAQYIPAGATVLDIGCGKMALEKFLPYGCRYLPADLVARDDRTTVCDLNAGQFPQQQASRADVITLLGVIEYCTDIAHVLRWLRSLERSVIITYHPADVAASLDRTALGWINHYPMPEWRRLLEDAGFAVANAERLSNIQYLFQLSPRPAVEIRPKRVAVLSYNNVGNFGDRLGYHLLQSVLPANVELEQHSFPTWNIVDPGRFDLLVLGIGNSIYQPLLTDELQRLVDAVPHVVGIFGTQYRQQIDAGRMRALLQRLDCWFARSEEDLLLYGDLCRQAEHLGDWLIDACSMAVADLDEPLVIGREVWDNPPLDRMIQKIQRHRTVISTRLHPLLCALTSAEKVEYSEQLAGNPPEPAGKFRSMLYDVFGRSYPENTQWRVDRDKVWAYKDKVAGNVARLRDYLHQTLE